MTIPAYSSHPLLPQTPRPLVPRTLRRGKTPPAVRSTLALALLLALLGVASACNVPPDGKSAFSSGELRPDVLPVMLNRGLPFRYPPALYAEKVQGNVTLRLYIDKNGAVVGDSTRIAESSKVPALDSAALKGVPELRFVPAKLHGAPMPVSILFPVYFRHPEAPPPAGDTILKHVTPPPAASNPAASKR